MYSMANIIHVLLCIYYVYIQITLLKYIEQLTRIPMCIYIYIPSPPQSHAPPPSPGPANGPRPHGGGSGGDPLRFPPPQGPADSPRPHDGGGGPLLFGRPSLAPQSP